VRGAAHARHTLGAVDGLERQRRRQSVRRHEALGERDDPGARRHGQPAEIGERLRERLRRDRQEDQVGAGKLVATAGERTDPQLARKLDAREIALVVVAAAEPVGLLGGAAQQCGAQAGSDEQDRDRGAERSRADYGGAPWVVARIANGGRVRKALTQLWACQRAPS
jgi:hypothetical protein